MQRRFKVRVLTGLWQYDWLTWTGTTLKTVWLPSVEWSTRIERFTWPDSKMVRFLKYSNGRDIASLTAFLSQMKKLRYWSNLILSPRCNRDGCDCLFTYPLESSFNWYAVNMEKQSLNNILIYPAGWCVGVCAWFMFFKEANLEGILRAFYKNNEAQNGQKFRTT